MVAGHQRETSEVERERERKREMTRSDSSPRQHHALAIPLPAQGHINPLMRLCETLAKAAPLYATELGIAEGEDGFIVTFLNIDPIHERLKELGGNKEHENGRNGDARPTNAIRKAHIPIDGLDLSNDFRMSIQRYLEAQASLVPAIDSTVGAADPPVTCTFNDFSMSSPSAAVRGIRRINLFPSNATTLLMLAYVVNGLLPLEEVLKVVMDPTMDTEAVFKEGLPGLPTLKNGDLLNIKHLEDENMFIYKFLTGKLKEYNEQSDAIVVNSFQELEPDSFAALSACLKVPVYPVGPLVGSSINLWKEDEECLEWLDRQPSKSVLYISFGSVALLSPAQFTELLAALESSGQRFIWVFRPGLIEGSPESSMPTEFLEKTKDQGRVVSWAPQIRILSHPSLGAFFSHCGWNSTLEAVTHGVPILCFPYFYDQFINAKYVVEVWEIGLLFISKLSLGEKGVVEREEIERLFKVMLEGEQSQKFQKNAIQLREAGRRTNLEGGTTYNNIKSLLKML